MPRKSGTPEAVSPSSEESPEERAARVLAVLEDIRVLHERILARRGGVPFSDEEIEDAWREVREGGSD
jgi:hypothetical protein